MYGVITEKELKTFLDFKRPNKAAGCFNDCFSDNVHQFLAMLESRSDYSGSMAILPKVEANGVFEGLFDLLKGLLVQDYGYSDREPEIFIALWELKNNESLVIALDVFGHAYLSPALFRNSNTVNKISFKNSDFSSIQISKFDENFKNALNQIKKG